MPGRTAPCDVRTDSLITEVSRAFHSKGIWLQLKSSRGHHVRFDAIAWPAHRHARRAREAGPAGRGHTASRSGWRFSASFAAGITSRHASSTTHGGVCWMPQVRHFDDLANVAGKAGTAVATVEFGTLAGAARVIDGRILKIGGRLALRRAVIALGLRLVPTEATDFAWARSWFWKGGRASLIGSKGSIGSRRGLGRGREARRCDRFARAGASIGAGLSGKVR